MLLPLLCFADSFTSALRATHKVRLPRTSPLAVAQAKTTTRFASLSRSLKGRPRSRLLGSFFFEFFVRRTDHSEVSGCATKATCPCLVIALTDAVLHLVGRRRIWGQTLSMLVFFSFFLSFLRSLFLSFFLSFDSIRRRYRGGFEFSPAVFADALRG